MVKIRRACPDHVYDFEGNKYKVTPLDGFCWTDNIRSTIYSSDGITPIAWANPYYCPEYPNTAMNDSIFGLLYTWYSTVNVPEGDDTAMPTFDTDGFVQGICPDGFHVPTRAVEWASWNTFSANDLKSTNYWLKDPGTDLYDWDGRPAGWYSGEIGKFIDLYGVAFWWAVEDPTAQYGYYFSINYYCSEPREGEKLKTDGLSVRCVMDY